MKFDFVLFENYYLATNHYKDVGIIARLLKECNYSVAIADVTGRDGLYGDEGVPLIHSSFKYAGKLKYHGKLSFFESIKNRWYVFLYYISLYILIKGLTGKCKGIYAGSFYTRMPIWWFYLLPQEMSIFFWGLRSSRLIEYKHSPFTISGINSFFLRRLINKKKNIKFFVSDELIRDEFVDLGIELNRLVIRPERIIDEICTSVIPAQSDTLQLLTMGSIRKQKRIELCLDALRRLGSERVSYTIAGITYNAEYENLIAERSKGVSGIKRLNYRVPEQEYNTLLREADFFVLCDEQQLSMVTNGTMNEALLLGTPIIAPNYNPYKYYVEKYGVGLLYDPKDIGSLSATIEKALLSRKESFADNIVKYQKTLLSSSVSRQFREDMTMAIRN